LATTSSAQGGAGTGGSQGGAGGGTGGSGGSGGGGGSVSNDCGTVWIVSDDFEDGFINPDMWSVSESSSGLLTESGGSLVVNFPASANDDVGLRSRFAYDFTDRTVTLEVPLPLVDPTGGDMEAWFAIGLDSDNYVEFYIDNGVMAYGYEIDGNYTAYLTEQYDPTTQRWLRFEHQGAKVAWLVSPDGVTWTQRTDFDVDQVFDPRWTTINFGVYASTASESISYQFDNMNADAPSEAHCAMSSWTDDFADGELSDGWQMYLGNGGCTTYEFDGELVIDCTTGADDYLELVSRSAFDLTGSSLTVENPSASEPGSEMLHYVFVGDAQQHNGFHLVMEAGTTYVAMLVNDNYSNLSQSSYGAGERRWSRIREDGGTVFFEASADGLNWEQLHSTVPPFDYTALQYEFEGATSVTLTADTSVSFDNLNLPP